MDLPRRSARSPLYGGYNYKSIFNTSGTVGGLALLESADNTINVVSEKHFVTEPEDKFQASCPALPLCAPKIGKCPITQLDCESPLLSDINLFKSQLNT